MIKITPYEIKSDKLPEEFDGFKIAHISDTHSRPPAGTADTVRRQNPDIAVITGDMLHDDDKPYDGFVRLVSELAEICPVFAITGNHDVCRSDIGRVLKMLRKMGVHILDDRRVLLRRSGAKIAMYGVGDPFSKVPDIISENVDDAFSRLPEYSGYKILLFHRANLFELIKERGYDLILSGHMHGGQICLGKFGGVLAPTSAILSHGSMVFPKYCRGRYDHNGTTMLVNCGLGNTLPIPRLGNPPEVGIITLRSAKPE